MRHQAGQVVVSHGGERVDQESDHCWGGLPLQEAEQRRVQRVLGTRLVGRAPRPQGAAPHQVVARLQGPLLGHGVGPVARGMAVGRGVCDGGGDGAPRGRRQPRLLRVLRGQHQLPPAAGPAPRARGWMQGPPHESVAAAQAATRRERRRERHLRGVAGVDVRAEDGASDARQARVCAYDGQAAEVVGAEAGCGCAARGLQGREAKAVDGRVRRVRQGGQQERPR
mmetsp:Transcript_10330/g.19582  ORF Transcript_10330/g.19582 Transcript_10330/m.19582 type:complete len:225 (+) Transcript_10330:573-1247(+)